MTIRQRWDALPEWVQLLISLFLLPLLLAAVPVCAVGVLLVVALSATLDIIEAVLSSISKEKV